MPTVTAAIEFGRPGEEALVWLERTVAELKGNDPLAGVTVVAPNIVAGRAAMQRLARQGGYVNVRATRLADLAADIARPLVAGRQALTRAIELAAARVAARRTEALQPLANHLALAEALVGLFRELRRREIEPGGWREANGMAGAAAEAYGHFRELTAGYLDATDVRRLAFQALELAPAAREGLALFLPTRLDPADVALLAALAQRAPLRALFAAFEDELAGSRSLRDAASLAAALDVKLPATATDSRRRSEVNIIRAPDQREEVRETVRAVLCAMQAGVPLHRMAILYRQPESYASLVTDTLDVAGLPWCSLSGASLADSRPAQAMVDALRLPERNFAREALLRVVSSLPYRDRWPSPAVWDRVSREANVVRGIDQWTGRLRTYAEAEHERWAAYHAPTEEEPEPRPPAYIDGARRMADVVEHLEGLLRPPGIGAPWHAFVGWAVAIYDELCGPPDAWPQEEKPFARDVRQTLLALGDAGEVENATSLEVFVACLEQALGDSSRPAGQLGQGVLVGPVPSVVGMSFEQVFVVGLMEGAFPPAPPPNPFFPSESEDVLNLRAEFRQREREAFLTTVDSAAGKLTLGTAQAADNRAAFPSRWLLEMASELAGERLDVSTFAALPPGAHPWLRASRSAAEGLSQSTDLLSLDERRLVEAAAWRRDGGRLQRHALARRTDLPLARAIDMARARRSRELTPFDGNLHDVASTSASIARLFDPQRAMSATGLQSWAACPFSFLLERVLNVRPSELPEDRWTIDAARRGTLIHQVLEEFLRSLAGAEPPLGARPYTEADRELLRAIAARRFNDLRASGWAGNPLIWDATAADIWADLEMFLQEDQAWRADHGWQPARFEQRFGYDDEASWPALELQAAAQTLRFRGQIDRIDVSGGDKRVQLYDYKTGKSGEYKELDRDAVAAGRALQLALYSEVVQRNMPGREVGATYWFLSSRGGFAMEGLTQSATNVRSRLHEALGHVASGIRDGVYPAVPGEEDEFFHTFDHCRWCAYERVCPTSRDEQWLHKQGDPACQPYISLALPAAGS